MADKRPVVRPKPQREPWYARGGGPWKLPWVCYPIEALIRRRKATGSTGETPCMLVAGIHRERGMSANPVCGLCGHVMTFERCGRASAYGMPLCHADDHSCYNEVTGGTNHTHREVVPGCYRCGLGAIEETPETEGET